MENIYTPIATVDHENKVAQVQQQVKEVLRQEPVVVQPGNDALPEENRTLTLQTEGMAFDAAYYPEGATQQRLYVFLSAAGKRNKQHPLFQRLSWAPFLTGYSLYVEDPMYKKFPELEGGYYYGDASTAYLKVLAHVIATLAEQLKIPKANIVFIGSSAAGYAALYLGDEVKGAKAFAMNPRLVMQGHKRLEEYTAITGTDYSTNDGLGRDSLYRIANNTDSTFLILCNAQSDMDYNKQMKPFAQHLGLKLNYGINSRHNVHIAIANIRYRHSHHTFPDYFEAKVLLDILEQETFTNHDVYPALKLIERSFQNKELAFYHNLWSHFLHLDFPVRIMVPETCSTRTCCLTIRDKPHAHYEINYISRNNDFMISLIIQPSCPGRSELLPLAEALATLKGYGFTAPARKKSDLVIKQVSISEKDLHSAMLMFLNNTYALVPE